MRAEKASVCDNLGTIYRSVLEYKLEGIESSLSDIKAGNGRVKNLTFNLLEASKSTVRQDGKTISAIAKCIQRWEEEKSVLLGLRADMMSCYSFRKDVSRIFLCREGRTFSFVIVVDDSTSDTVFDYNEFGFMLSERYQDIEDFMVIDEEEAKGCSQLLSSYDKIYQRG